MQTLINIEDLRQSMDKPDWFILDCRFSLADEDLGETAYKTDHISGAIYAHLNRDLSGKIIHGKTGRHPLPGMDQWISTIRRWGVTADAQVLVYDEGPGAFAARAWWMFRWAGHANVAVLDGGFSAWQRQGYPTSGEIPSVQVSKFEQRPSLTRIISAGEIMESKGVLTLLDARMPDRFNGSVEPIDPVAGHIPDAICAPFAENLLADQTFRTTAALKRRFEDLGVAGDVPPVCYCGSGVTAAHNILALVHAGFAEPILYPGSWSEWIKDPDRPIATG